MDAIECIARVCRENITRIESNLRWDRQSRDDIRSEISIIRTRCIERRAIFSGDTDVALKLDQLIRLKDTSEFLSLAIYIRDEDRKCIASITCECMFTDERCLRITDSRISVYDPLNISQLLRVDSEIDNFECKTQRIGLILYSSDTSLPDPRLDIFDDKNPTVTTSFECQAKTFFLLIDDFCDARFRLPRPTDERILGIWSIRKNPVRNTETPETTRIECIDRLPFYIFRI